MVFPDKVIKRGVSIYQITAGWIKWYGLGAVLGLPPIQRAMANDQMKSRFLEAIFRGDKNS